MPEFPPLTLAARFLSVVEANPDQIAIEEAGRAYSYAELRGRASATAHLLQAEGVGPDILVAVCGVRSIDYFVAMVGIILAGGAYMPIAPDTPTARIADILKSSRPKVILVEREAEHLFSKADSSAKVLPFLTDDTKASAEPPHCAATPDSLAYVMFTSGSTGTPKGVTIPQVAVVKLVCDTNYISLEAGDRVLAHSALTFDAITFEAWGPLLNGATMVVKPVGTPRLEDYAAIFRNKAVDTAFITTALFRELAEWDPTCFAPLRRLLTGGEVGAADLVRRALADNPALTILAVYGPTECTTFATAFPFQNAVDVPDELPLGRAISATEVRVLRADGQPAAVGEVGEIYIGGPRISRGYLDRPDLSETAFVQLDEGGIFYRTGDYGTADASGTLFFRGRCDRQIKLRGYRIELEEIETSMRAHPAVSAAVAKVIERDGGRDPMIIAYATLNNDALSTDSREQSQAVLTNNWRDVYSELLYSDLAATGYHGGDPTLNTAGWKSSYDGRHIDDAQMLEQVNQAVDRVLAKKPSRVLEVGCGTGMLLFRIAPECSLYVGTDFSQAALDYVAKQVSSDGLDDIVTLSLCPADKLPDAPEGGFDMVVINSVTEHFPSIHYLNAVLKDLRGKLAPGAYVYVGDNRNHTLLPLFHASVQLFRSEGQMPLSRFALQVALSVAEERQMTIDPGYFLEIGDMGYQCLSLQCRRGNAINEMTAFRYDAMLQFGGSATAGIEAPVANVLPDLPALFASSTTRPVAIGGLPNARNRGGDLLIQAITGTSPLATVGDLRRAIEQAPTGIQPEEIWLEAEVREIAAEIRPRIGSMSGEFDLWLSPAGTPPVAWTAPARPLDTLANDPTQADRFAVAATALRAHLKNVLPEYAVPSFVVALPHFVTTAHGKIDVAALPLPDRLRKRRSEARETGIHGEDTVLIRRCWETVLGLHDIEDNEDFFELGGNSIKTVRLVEEIRKLSGLSLSPAHIFERPTLSGLAKFAGELRQATSAPEKAAPSDTRGHLRRKAVTRQRTRADAGGDFEPR